MNYTLRYDDYGNPCAIEYADGTTLYLQADADVIAERLGKAALLDALLALAPESACTVEIQLYKNGTADLFSYSTGWIEGDSLAEVVEKAKAGAVAQEES